MKRLAIITVGKTHSGKTTFAKELEQQLNNSIVIDQDTHAEFINTYYKLLRPTQGPNTIKYAITNTIVDYAVEMTELHLILSNSNRNTIGRSKLLTYFHDKGFETVLVHFDFPDYILEERVLKSTRSKAIFRTASNFVEVLSRQNEESKQDNISDPIEGEADYFFVIKDPTEVHSVIEKLVALYAYGG